MTVPVPSLDKFTHLGEMGYNQKTLQERLDKFYQDLTALNTIGEILWRSLDQDMARQVLGITATGDVIINMPDADGNTKGKVKLAGDFAGTADYPTVPKMVTIANEDQIIDGNKSFTKPISSPSPTVNNHLANKGYVDSVVVPVGGISWAGMQSGSIAFMESASGTMISRLTARDDIHGIWRFPANSPPTQGGGLNAHEGDDWEVVINA